MTVLLTRPREDSERVASILEQRGFQAMVDPLLQIDQLPVPALEPGRHQAVVITSRHALPALAKLATTLPVFCVGEATAERARALGFTFVVAGPGDGAGLAAMLADALDPAVGPILHLSGSDIRTEPGDTLLARGFEVTRATVYRARAARTLRTQTLDALGDRRISRVLLFSPRSATIFGALASAFELAHLDALCLSADVAAALDAERFGRVLVAARRDEAALLDLLEAPGPG